MSFLIYKTNPNGVKTVSKTRVELITMLGCVVSIVMGVLARDEMVAFTGMAVTGCLGVYFALKV